MIQKLDPFVADKIAAGEVIERPLSVVKELVENSIDGQATRITVEIRHGGKEYIRVTDNGTGIPADQCQLAFERHATGKISTLQDLEAIGTLGFRGEALASICAVSRITMFSMTRDEDAGVKLEIHGGRVVAQEPFAMSPGTTMVVEDLFYNTPARRKFMKSDSAEARPIITLIQELAINYGEISFTLINNGTEVMSTDGRGNRFSAINRIYKSQDYKNLLEVHGRYVNGYISGPGVTRSTRRGQIFFVNGRIIESSVIEKAVMDGYGDRVFSGYPIAILFFDIPPEDLDVNIHPSKREIKLYDQKAVTDDIKEAIRKVMDLSGTIPQASQPSVPSREKEPVVKADAAGDSSDVSFEEIPVDPVKDHAVEYHSADDEKAAHEKESAPGYNAAVLEKSSGKIKTDPIDLKKFLAMQPEPEERRRIHDQRDTTTVQSQNHDILFQKSEDGDFDITPPVVRPFQFDDLQIKGYIFNSYILTQAGETIYLLDQHAAHERINYERLVKAYREAEHLPQAILVPFTIQTSADIYTSERGWLEDLRRMGFDMEDFGADTFIIRGIPSYMSQSEARVFAETYMEELGQLKSGNRVVIDKLIMRSCRMSVKANDRLSPQEMEKLLEQLSRCINPFSCPHGRPTFVSFTKDDIERWFKRK